MNTNIKSTLKSRALHISLLFLFAGAVFSCIKEVLPDSQQDNTEAQDVISVAQARTFFEQALVNNAARSTSGPGIKHGTLSPGDFTPLWNEAAASANDKIGAVEVPIISTYRYRSVHSHFHRGKATAHSVAATQKLLIVKSRTGETMGAFIMTVIPSDGSSASKFRHTGCRENFSGTVLYRSALRTGGLPSTVTMYRDGALTARVSAKAGDDRQQRISTIASVVKSLNLTRSTVSLTRSDDGEEEECPACGVMGCGGECIDKCDICGGIEGDHIPGSDCDPFPCPNCGNLPCTCGSGGGNTGDNGGDGEPNTPGDPCPECGATDGGCFCSGVVPVCEKCGKLIGDLIDPCICENNTDYCPNCGIYGCYGQCMNCENCGTYPCICDILML